MSRSLDWRLSYSAAAIETHKLRREVESARLILRELAIARDVQAALLPQCTPDLQGLDCAVFFRPAEFVGGDYYDFVETPDGALLFHTGRRVGQRNPRCPCFWPAFRLHYAFYWSAALNHLQALYLT